jgi:hypothetical protein
MANENYDDTLAHDMVEVHGTRAAAVARQNARTAALAGLATQATSWIRVLGIIQCWQAGQVAVGNSPGRSADDAALRKINFWI